MDKELIESVAKAICAACDEDPMHPGDCRGNDYRWQDYREPALAALQAAQENSLVAGYTADNIAGQSRAFTVYRDRRDAEFEANATGQAITPIYHHGQ